MQHTTTPLLYNSLTEFITCTISTGDIDKDIEICTEQIKTLRENKKKGFEPKEQEPNEKQIKEYDLQN
jgi:hypothetical protein